MGYPNFEASFIEFRMTRCTNPAPPQITPALTGRRCAKVEPYRRTPIVFSSRDVSGSTVQSVVVVDAPVATLFKGDDRFDGFSRDLGWTLKVTGSVVQNVVFRQTLPENDATHGVMVGAARTLDSVGAYACGPQKRRCNSLAVHYGTPPYPTFPLPPPLTCNTAGSIGNLTEADDGEQHPLFACDGDVPQQFSSYEAALYQLGQEDEHQKRFDYTLLEDTSCQGCFDNCQTGSLSELRVVCYQNYAAGCRAIICLNGDTDNCQLRNDTGRLTDYTPEDCYVLNLHTPSPPPAPAPTPAGTPLEQNTTLAERIAASKEAWNAALGRWHIYDGGSFHPHTVQSPAGQLTPEDGTTFQTQLQEVWWLAKTASSTEPRVVRCSGKGCPAGKTGCTEVCQTTNTAFDAYGLVQDWKLKAGPRPGLGYLEAFVHPTHRSMTTTRCTCAPWQTPHCACPSATSSRMQTSWHTTTQTSGKACLCSSTPECGGSACPAPTCPSRKHATSSTSTSAGPSERTPASRATILTSAPPPLHTSSSCSACRASRKCSPAIRNCHALNGPMQVPGIRNGAQAVHRGPVHGNLRQQHPAGLARGRDGGRGAHLQHALDRDPAVHGRVLAPGNKHGAQVPPRVRRTASPNL